MNGVNRLSAACAVGFFAVSQQGAASPPAETTKEIAVLDGSVQMFEKGAPIAKSALTQTLGSRATVTQTATLYGGFELRSTALVYILVRGNSLGTLGVTQAYLDAPRVRLYNSQGQDLVSQSGYTGFNFCLSANTVTDLPVLNYYANVRGQPAHSFDSCYAAVFAAGVYTFSVTPSIPGVTTIAGQYGKQP